MLGLPILYIFCYTSQRYESNLLLNPKLKLSPKPEGVWGLHFEKRACQQSRSVLGRDWIRHSALYALRENVGHQTLAPSYCSRNPYKIQTAV